MSESIGFRLSTTPLQVQFDGPQLTSDGGLCWLAEADAALGLCGALAAQIPEWRRGPVRHALETLVRQRVFQLACGYADQDDADTLRHDPLLKLVCGRLPEQAALASQPTLSRLENAVDARSCYRLAAALVQVYLQAREQAGTPTQLVLDLDGTDAPVHGQQEQVAYHGYYGQYMYHPLLVFDGETGQLITAVLRPGTCAASRGAVGVLRRLVRVLRARWPQVPITVRADAGFASPALYAYLEDQEHLTYTIGLVPNQRLAALAAPLAAEATRLRAQTGEKVRLLAETTYQADSWPKARRVVYKAEALDKGQNVRFVLTNRTDPPAALYAWYIQRGDRPELCIKDLKDACFATRLSDHRFWANQCRLLFHAAAYWLLDTLRRWLAQRQVPHLQLDTLRLRLIKIGGWLQRHRHNLTLHLASSHPGESLWHLLATRPGPP